MKNQKLHNLRTRNHGYITSKLSMLGLRYGFASLSSLIFIHKLKLTKYYPPLISVENFSVYDNICDCKNS